MYRIDTAQVLLRKVERSRERRRRPRISFRRGGMFQNDARRTVMRENIEPFARIFFCGQIASAACSYRLSLWNPSSVWICSLVSVCSWIWPSFSEQIFWRAFSWERGRSFGEPGIPRNPRRLRHLQSLSPRSLWFPLGAVRHPPHHLPLLRSGATRHLLRREVFR